MSSEEISSEQQKEIEERLEAKKREQQQQTDKIDQITIKDDEEEDEEKDKGVVFDKKKFPGASDAEYRRYWDTIGAERSRYLTELAKQSVFVIPIYNKADPKLDDPDAELTSEDMQQITQMQTQDQEFRFFDVTPLQWEHIQEFDYDIQEARRKAESMAKNAPKGGLSPEQLRKIKDELLEKDKKKYRYTAKVFFRMTKDQIDRADQRALKNACDAAIHRTIASVPKSAGTSNSPFM